MTSPLTDAARSVLGHLDYLVEAWPDLVTMGVAAGGRRRLPSSRRHRPDAVVLAQAAEARAELLERRQIGWVPGTGKHPAPVDVDMLDLIRDVVAAAEDLALTITQTAGVDRPSHVTSVWEDPRPWLLSARAWLTAADEVDDLTVPWARSVLAPVVRRVASTVGEILDGQVIDALCPWCRGRSEKRPNGGERTLMVAAPGQASTGARPEATAPGQGDGPLVVCHGTNCAPPDSACGRRLRGMPAWPEREWDWLAKQLLPLDGADTPHDAAVVAG